VFIKAPGGKSVLDTHGFCLCIQKFSDRLKACEGLLNELDNRIGDGDHGTNMVRGFSLASADLTTNLPVDIGAGATRVAMALLSNVGGASGPLYGTAFLRFGSAWKGMNRVDHDAVAAGVRSALEGIQTRGKAEVGDKTMVDVWSAFVAGLSSSDESPKKWIVAALGAQQAAKATKDMTARRGRAAYLGERSIGVADPGSISSAMLLEELVDSMVGGVERIEWQSLALY
jgi:phosphoenolpyruvate---glycerone phosphotransferase subunit DhaL